MFGSGNRFRLGQIGGHQIFLDWIAFGILALIVFSQFANTQFATAFVVAAFLSILVHELGHAFAISRLTRQKTAIVIGFGGVTLSDGTRYPGRQVLISLAGPLAGAVLGVACWMVARASVPGHEGWPPWQLPRGFESTVWDMFLYHMTWISVAWTILNLLPVWPLDGGQALRALLLVWGMPPLKARLLTRGLALVVAIGGGAWFALEQKNYFMAFIAFWIVMDNLDEARRDRGYRIR
jgi:Zn-dependent protease